MQFVFSFLGKTEKFLANEIAEHELKVEQLVCAPLAAISEHDLPAIMKAKKHLTRLINEKESALSRYNVSIEIFDSFLFDLLLRFNSKWWRENKVLLNFFWNFITKKRPKYTHRNRI